MRIAKVQREMMMHSGENVEGDAKDLTLRRGLTTLRVVVVEGVVRAQTRVGEATQSISMIPCHCRLDVSTVLTQPSCCCAGSWPSS